MTTVLGLLLCGGTLWADDPQVLIGHTDPVYAVDFTPDGRWIVTGSFDKSLKLWDAQKLQPVRTMTGHTGLVLSVRVSKDGSRIASGGLDKTIKLWDVPLNTPLADLAQHPCGATA